MWKKGWFITDGFSTLIAFIRFLSSVEQALSSEKRPCHIPYTCVVLLLWGWPFGVLIYPYIEKFLHTLDPGKNPVNSFLQKSALGQIHQLYSWPYQLKEQVDYLRVAYPT